MSDDVRYEYKQKFINLKTRVGRKKYQRLLDEGGEMHHQTGFQNKTYTFRRPAGPTKTERLDALVDKLERKRAAQKKKDA